MENDGGPVPLEQPAHLRPVLHVRESGHRGREVAFVLQLALDVDERVLCVVDEDEPLRAQRRKLAAELGRRSSRRRR